MFAYDIRTPARAVQIRRLLAGSRIDGQLSIAEVSLPDSELCATIVELHALADPDTDNVLYARLAGPPVVIAHPDRIGKIQPSRRHAVPVATLKKSNGQSIYLLAYDITDSRRSSRVHRLVAGHCLYLQRSLYLFIGKRSALHDILRQISSLLGPGDDFRLYAPLSLGHIWVIYGHACDIKGITCRPALGPDALSTSHANGILGSLRRWVTQHLR